MKRLLTAFVLLLALGCAPSASAAIAFVTTAKGIDTYDGTTGTTVATAAWNLANTDRLIVVAIRWDSAASAQTVSTVTDTAGNTYVSAIAKLDLPGSGGVGSMQMYYCKATTATNASNVVTVTFSAATAYKSVLAAEYSGADTTAPLDVTASATNANAGSVTSGSFTPTRSGEVSVAIGAHGPAETGTYTAGTNYTKRDVTTANGGDHLVLEDRLLAPQSSQTAGLTSSANFWHGIIVATFKTAGLSLIGAGSAAIGTTASYDTRGANLIVVGTIQDTSAQAFTNSTSDAASYTGLTGQSAGGGANTFAKLWYLYNPATSATHTFTAAVSYGSIFVLAFSGAATPPFDVENGATSASATSLAAGSITPSVNNEVVVYFSGVGDTASSYTVSGGGFSTVQLSVNAAVGVNYGGAMSYLIQTTATATNPAHSWTGSAHVASVIASFKEVTGGAVAAVKRLLLVGVGGAL